MTEVGTEAGRSSPINKACVGVAMTWLALFVMLIFGAILTSEKTPIHDDSDQTASTTQE